MYPHTSWQRISAVLRVALLLIACAGVIVLAQRSLEIVIERQDLNSRRIERMENENLPVRLGRVETDLSSIAERLDRLENMAWGGLGTVLMLLGTKVLEWGPRRRNGGNGGNA